MSLSASAENLNGDKQQTYDGSSNMCLELAIEGERLCKAGDCRAGVAFFQAAIQARTDDLRTLSAIYSQLGNAYFYLGDYAKAMQYHRHDLTLARTLGDKLGEAKSSGNLGNTLKVMGRFDEAAAFCQRHLELARELGDELSEGRALYNLGNVWHAKGKSVGKRPASESGAEDEQQQAGVRMCLQRAAGFYEENLALMRRLGDVAAQGRACGNLGNTHYLLGDFAEAIKHHEERLSIARQFGDKAAERRAHSNLGNSHIFLGHLDTAAQHYRLTLALAQELGDRAVEAQACYSLGNTHTLLREHQTALDYHLRHLAIAQQLGDKVGEARACWSLGNAHASMCQHERALEYAREHLRLSRALGDAMGEATARMNVQDLRKVLNLAEAADDADMSDKSAPDHHKNAPADSRGNGAAGFAARVRRDSMEQLDLFKLTPDGKAAAPSRLAASLSSGSVAKQLSTLRAQDSAEQEVENQQEDSFFDLVSRFQAERMDDQRCTLSAAAAAAAANGATTAANNKENTSANANAAAVGGTTTTKDDLMDMIAGMQSNRMDEQRAALPNLPGLVQRHLHNNNRNNNNNNNNNNTAEQNNNNAAADCDDVFLEQVARCQGSGRMDDQRSPLPVAMGGSVATATTTTVPDDDFFSLLMRFQGSGRMDDQRASIVVPRAAAAALGNGAVAPLTGLSRYLNHLNGDKHKKK